ncbi:alpha amylase family protein [Carboxylicivirga taeanensis]|uniref:alpha amylase family protein n=1 Tax=Carboxylicivirga taeanensis TaxID=1416875 RepID=UPI003F6DE07C
MKKTSVLFLIFAIVLAACNSVPQKKKGKEKLMWFDATANFERFSNKDSIDFYLEKIADLGFTHAVVDVRPIDGSVLYPSKIANELKEWKGYKRGDFDYLGYFIQAGHKYGLEVHASLNIFVAGHNHFDLGPVYEDHPEWGTIVYSPEQGLTSITNLKNKYSAMVNPVNMEYQAYIISILEEVTTMYPKLDGIITDRVRYDGIMGDFSDLSKATFEKVIGQNVANWPTDIYEWQKDENGKNKRVDGPLFKQWIEWRAQVIYDFMAKSRAAVKAINPDISYGTYTGAWYPSYYEVGVNWASKNYDPSQEFDWASAEYKNTGYAELMDLYTTGNYYTNVTIEEHRAKNEAVWNETDSEAQKGDWYCVEGSCKNLRRILGDNKFYGGILVDQFYNNRPQLSQTIAMNIKESDGLMVFDIVHIIDENLWKEVEEGLKAEFE